MLSECGIYQIVSPNNSFYIGMTSTSFTERWKNHLKELRSGKHKCKGLQRAFDKYGEEHLSFEIIQLMTNEPQEEILKAEVLWWKKYKNWGINIYNGEPTGTGSVKHTNETRDRISQALKNKSVLIVCSYKNCDVSFYAKSKKHCSQKCRNMDTVILCSTCSNSFSSPSQKRKRCFDCLKPSNKTSPKSKKRIMDLYNEGFSLRQISTMVSMSHITVRNVLIDSNIELRDYSSNNKKI